MSIRIYQARRQGKITHEGLLFYALATKVNKKDPASHCPVKLEGAQSTACLIESSACVMSTQPRRQLCEHKSEKRVRNAGNRFSASWNKIPKTRQADRSPIRKPRSPLLLPVGRSVTSSLTKCPMLSLFGVGH